MKLSKISVGVAAVIGVMSAPAHALLASSYTNTGEFVGDTQNIRISGATAQDPGVLASVLRLCSGSTMTMYATTNNFVYFCTADATKITLRSGATKLAVYKHGVGGSGSGVGVVNSATPIAFMDLTKMGACTATSATVDADGTATNLATYQYFNCTDAASSLTSNQVSYIGISDVEPQFFGAPSSYANLNASALTSVIFGLPVTKAAYEKLQVGQNLVTAAQLLGATAGTCGAAGLNAVQTEACMPSLSQTQITTLLTQEGQTWANVTGIEVNAADDIVYVARRVDSSGTQKTFEALVAKTLNGTSGARQCASEVEPFVSGTVAADNTVANTVCNGSTITMNGSGSGQVAFCLDKHQTAGRGAIGVLSTETKQTAAGAFRFVKINGYAPTHANVARGLYTTYSDASINLRAGTTLPTLSALGYSNFVTVFKTAFANPATIAVINAGPQPFGPAGLMAMDAIASPLPKPDFTGVDGRNPWSRLVGNTDLNNCQAGKLAQ